MLLSFGKKWVCSYIQILQLTSTSRLCQSKPWELRFLPEGRKQGSATGISKRNLYSGCWKLASWLLVSWLPGIPISVTQALSPGSDLTLTVRSDYIGQILHHQMWFLYKMVKPLQREHGPGLQQFKIELKWTTCGHHVDFEWLLCGDHIEPTSSPKYQKKYCTSQETLYNSVWVLGSQPHPVQGAIRLSDEK